MLFTSLRFVLFLALTMLLYYLLPGRGQRAALLLANYIFYMWWEPKFGLLLLAGTAATYAAARALQARLWGRRKLWMVLGLTVMLGQLLLFKYGDFFLLRRGLAADPASDQLWKHLGQLPPGGIGQH
jgi:D-alanyl-lipoteichoic acid acyltransferase DltB (MBOAT superfamily)